MPRIFLSYRQVDRSIAERIHDRLIATFGESDIVTDISDIPDNVSYRRGFSNALQDFETIIIVMGQGWNQLKEASNGPNPTQPDDFTRIQVGTALSTTDKILVPIFVNDATMPHEATLPNDLASIVHLRPATVRNGKNAFERDMDALVRERLEPVHRRYDVPDAADNPAITSQGLGVALMMLLTVVPLGIIFAIACNLVFGVSGALVEVATGDGVDADSAAQIEVIPTLEAGTEPRLEVTTAENIAELRSAPTDNSETIAVVSDVESLTAVGYLVRSGDDGNRGYWVLVAIPDRQDYYGWVDDLYLNPASLETALETLAPFVALANVETNFPIGRNNNNG